MNILLTGGAGYIGSHIAVELLKLNYKIIIIDNFLNSNINAIDGIKKISKKNFKFYNIDLRVPDNVDYVFSNNQIDCIIHLAGFKSVSESISSPLKYYENNINSTINILNAMEKYSVKNIIFSSTAMVYSIENKMPLSEKSKIKPSSPYGFSKLFCEQIIEDFCIKNNSSAVILRYFNPIGAHYSGIIGENPVGIPNNLMPFILNVASGKEKNIKIFGNDYDTKDGTGARDYVHIFDLAMWHISAIDFCKKNKGIEIFNLGTGKGTTVLEIINEFEKVSNIKIPIIISERRIGDMPISYTKTKKAQMLLNYKAQKSIEEMCFDAYNYYKKHI